ncbi:amino acid ABC transporter substrate-binding protein [Ureibacillus massiliensis 4400831 = CIP 108448 = CCUG 49529]|uniref:Amino acid ABC transporter substrate-binding protein n=1 Tax=Ureibacillus massiliensis 4400831 = CIP 108448 = CCUG 49529 TaxID=1211035 RepID=A0A0A3J670_9BACL|nr:transporter substrate-binding domain-containing protein [Ureibacillus massiliensis]KGR92401.1 amino acid ABC transporter substrate-binding protein [Ureibacillus massiliensis 4400831 = CIP 108448 = CCUG 49529]
MNFKQLGKLFALSFATVSILAACGNNETATENEQPEKVQETQDVTKIKVAFAQAAKPITYVDENGNPAGYDVEAMMLVDEALEDYEFEFVPTTDEDLFIGVEQGKYQVGVKNAFYTEEREENFLFPKEFLGLSSAGLLLPADQSNIKNLSDFATSEMTLAPIAASSAQYTLVADYNEANPFNEVELEAGEEFNLDVVQWVNEGRADGAITIEALYTAQVLDENGPYYEFKDDLVYNEFAVIKTWPLFNKEQEQFAAAYDEAIKEIRESGALSELMEKHYGKDLFPLLEQVN